MISDKFVEVCANPRDGALDVAIFRLNPKTGAYYPNRYRITKESFANRNLPKILVTSKYNEYKRRLYGNSFCYYF